MIRITSIACLLAAFAFLLVSLPSDADGFAAIRRSDRPEDYIRIAEESAIIVWDPVKKIEHFIRSAAFDTKSPDFGFLVPTPNVPVLKEVEQAVFKTLGHWMLPRVAEQTRMKYDPLSCMCCPCIFGFKAAAPMDKASVRVLQEQKIGGYDTAILEADSTQGLADWLKKNKYSDDAELQSWLVPYIGAKWKITAFKISQDPATGKLATTKPVRMSFATDRPFFPYREPEVKDDKKVPPGPRLLRVFFISDTRMDGKLGGAAWHARIPWSDQLTDEQRTQFAKETGVPEAEVPAKAWMTTFEDASSPRPGKEEVYFDPAQDRTPIRPPDIIRYRDVWIPIDLVVLGCCVVLIVVIGGVLMLRARRTPTPP